MSVDWLQADWPAPESVVAGTTLRNHSGDELPVAGVPCFLNQVHGSSVVVAQAFATPPEADASLSGEHGHVCVVRTADCLPVLICSRDGNAIAAAHAGWRGLAAGVLENTVAAFDCPADQLLAWFGPAIAQSSFEVGDEVRAAFLAQHDAARTHFEPNDAGRWQADLYGLARQRLETAGLHEIFGGGLCTFADPERFYSYRRNADRGRMLSFIGHRKP